jgi:hypothetical protein
MFEQKFLRTRCCKEKGQVLTNGEGSTVLYWYSPGTGVAWKGTAIDWPQTIKTVDWTIFLENTQIMLNQVTEQECNVPYKSFGKVPQGLPKV